MFDSDIFVSDLISDVLSSADISSPVSENVIIESYNRTEQLLYSEIIKEQALASGFLAESGIYDFDLASVSKDGAAQLRYEDIVSCYVEGKELTPTNLNSVKTMRNSFCKHDNNLCIHSNGGPIEIVYNVRPSIAEKSTSYISKCIPVLNFAKYYNDNDVLCYADDKLIFYVLVTKLNLSALICEGANVDNVSVGNVTLKKVEDYIDLDTFKNHSGFQFYYYNPDNGDFSFSYLYNNSGSLDDFKSYVLSDQNLSLNLLINYTEKISSKKTVKLPLEFVDMMRCKLKSDMYNFANDESNAAKWLDMYNNYLDNFKAFLLARTSTFGR